MLGHLHCWNRYSFQLQASYSQYPNHQTQLPKVMLIKSHADFHKLFNFLKLLLQIAVASISSACVSLENEAARWICCYAPISPLKASDYIWYFTDTQFCSDLKFVSSIYLLTESQLLLHRQQYPSSAACAEAVRPRSQNRSDNNAHTNQNQLQLLLKNSLTVFKVQQLLN